MAPINPTVTIRTIQAMNIQVAQVGPDEEHRKSMGQVVVLASGRSMLCPLGLSASRILSRRKYRRNSREVPHSDVSPPRPSPSPQHQPREIAQSAPQRRHRARSNTQRQPRGIVRERIWSADSGGGRGVRDDDSDPRAAMPTGDRG